MTRCMVCCHDTLVPVEGFAELVRVGSDSRPLPPGGRLSRCTQCGAVQKPVDKAYLAECEDIYANYTMYAQSSQGTEPSVFDGEPCGRSTRLMLTVAGEIRLPETGRILDVGCGNGNLLRAFGAIRPGWKRAGLELDGRHRDAVETACGPGSLHTGQLANVPGEFDLVTAMHVLEHLTSPVEFLKTAADRLTPGGHVLVQLPLWQDNPFDLVVADHCMHYDRASLIRVLKRAGLEPVFVSDQAVPRELTVVARPGIGFDHKEDNGTAPDRAVTWLTSVRDLAARVLASAGRENFGIFGTGNAAMWLTEGLGGVGFYVDDDPTRQGVNALTGKPVLGPDSVPDGATVLICLPPELSATIEKRVRHLPVNWLVTPPLENTHVA